MKKVLLIVIVIALFTLPLAACSQAPVPGSAWANKEVLEYEVRDEVEGLIGTLTTTITRHDERAFYFASLEREISIKDTVTKGTFIKTEFRNLENNIILTSEVLMDGFSMAASYKSQIIEGEEYVTRIIYNDKGVSDYSVKKDGATINSGSMRIRGTAIDPSAIYTYFRSFNVGANGFSATIDVPDVISGSAQTLSFSNIGKENIADIPLGNGASNDFNTIETIKTRISRTEAPIGDAIIVYYAANKNEYKIIGVTHHYDSFRIPVRIIENNLTYTLKSVVEVD